MPYVLPFPAKVREVDEAAEKTIVEELILPEAVEDHDQVGDVAVAVSVNVLVPAVMLPNELVPRLFVVTEKPPVTKVQEVSTLMPELVEPVESASSSVYVPPNPLKLMMFGMVLPAEVIV